MLHDRANTLGPGEVGMNGGPVLRFDFLLKASFAAQEDGLFTDLHLDRLAHRSKLLTRNRANLLHADAELVAAVLFGGDPTTYLELPTGWFTSAMLIGAAASALAFMFDILPGNRSGRRA